MATLKTWRANWGLIFLIPFAACMVCLVAIGEGHPSIGDLGWAAFACVYTAVHMMQNVFRFTTAGRAKPKAEAAPPSEFIDPRTMQRYYQDTSVPTGISRYGDSLLDRLQTLKWPLSEPYDESNPAHRQALYDYFSEPVTKRQEI